MTVHRKTKSIAIASALVLLGALIASALALTEGRSGSGTSRDGQADRHRPQPRATPSPSGPPRGELERRIGEFAAPFRGDSGYREPSPTDRRTVAESVGLVLDGKREEAAQTLSRVGYQLRTLVDAETGRTYAELSDRSETVPAPRGWGRVYIDLSAPVRWSVQAPHPVADARTERLGARVLLGSPGGVLVIAGAHRDAGRGNSADVAHRRDTVFAAVCDELAQRGLPGIQVHGFADDSDPDHDVIASTGTGMAGRADGKTLADALRGEGFEVCRAWARSCPLEGTENVEGRKAAAENVPFLHVEFSNTVRTDDARTRRAVTAVDTLTARWAAGQRNTGRD
ncbi:hypothetical protein ACFYZ9_18765 [Streptomyces sp. NPDC001691]|uniref:hypothetical protein n=1 Tax=Streptomyces sp. NPDC001691 TaxID=3364600 RepID=UPI0036A54C00